TRFRFHNCSTVRESPHQKKTHKNAPANRNPTLVWLEIGAPVQGAPGPDLHNRPETSSQRKRPPDDPGWRVGNGCREPNNRTTCYRGRRSAQAKPDQSDNYGPSKTVGQDFPPPP